MQQQQGSISGVEGYDPESKGKVESGVKYVQHNGLYGEEFKDWQGLESYIVEWLDAVANQRLHGTTCKQPSVHYEFEERAKMLPYFTPSMVSTIDGIKQDRWTKLVLSHGNQINTLFLWRINAQR